MITALILAAGCFLAGEEKPAEALSPIAQRIAPVVKSVAAKIAGKKVLVVAVSDPRNPPDTWRVLGEIRDQAAICLRNEGAKARFSSKIEAALAEREKDHDAKPLDPGSLPDLTGSELIFRISYTLKGKTRTLAMSLIEITGQREVWKGPAVLEEADVEISKYIPPLNRKVLEFAMSQQGKRVGDGESSTLTKEAIQSTGPPDESRNFFAHIGPRDPIFPGDCLWLQGEKFHSAIVHHVTGESKLQLIQQDFDGSGKGVSIIPFDLRQRREGKVSVGRPGTQTEEDAWYLGQLEFAPLDDFMRESYIGILHKRECVAVIPYLLQQWHEEPLPGTIGLNMGRDAYHVDQLESFGPSVIPYLIQALDNAEVEREHHVVLRALADYGPCAETALPALLRYLKKPRSFDFDGVLNVLATIGQRAEPAIPALLEFAKDPAHKPLRWWLLAALECIGPAGERAAIPLLTEAIRAEKGEEFSRAVEALERIEPGRPETVEAIVPLLKDENPSVRLWAAGIASRLGEHAKAAVPGLLDLMNGDKEPRIVRKAASLLDAIDSERGLKVFLPALSDEREEPTQRAVVALGGFRSRAKEVVPLLIRFTRSPDEQIAIDAIESLGALGGGAAPAIPRLVEICRIPTSEKSLAAIKALEGIGMSSPETIQELSKLAAGEGKIAEAAKLAVERLKAAGDP
jgi:HEAT repeat protein